MDPISLILGTRIGSLKHLKKLFYFIYKSTLLTTLIFVFV